MPFTRTGADSYTSPSGRKFNGRQVRMYEAHGGHFPGQPGFSDGGGVPMSFVKGSAPQAAHYAEGGPVLGRTKDFMKMKDEFREDKPTDTADKNYGKSGPGAGTGEVKPPAVRAKAKGDKIKC